MPGCLSYVVARDPADADAIWITEVWVDAASHKASLALPSVQAAIAEARPLIAGFDSSVVDRTGRRGRHFRSPALAARWRRARNGIPFRHLIFRP